MAKVVLTISVLATCVIAILCLFVQAYSTYTEDMGHSYDERDLYALTTVVAEVDREYNTVYCVDFNGEKWAFYGCEDWAEGDIATMVMYNNGTSIIYDDVILSAKYCGWFEGWER